MAKKGDGPNQSEFIREKLRENADVKYRVVSDAWKEAKHPGEIKSSLFYLVKNKMGVGKPKRAIKKRPGPKPNTVPTPASAPPAAVESDVTTTYRAIEHALDSLVRKADELKNASLAEDLRNARRRVSAKLV